MTIENVPTKDRATAQEDLAFLRQLMASNPGANWQASFGRLYAAWGMGFAVPVFLEWLRIIGVIGLSVWFWPVAAAVVTILILAVSIVEKRRSGPIRGAQGRAANAIFTGIGLANAAVLFALAAAAWTSGDWRVLMLHGVVVVAFQGAAWYGVWALTRRPWTGLVAAGWLIAAVGLGASLVYLSWFVLIAAVSLVLLMAVPGLAMALAARPK